MKDKSTLVFTIALNGYQYLYAKNIRSQRSYALKHGYDYVAVTRPAFTLMGMECAWLKLTLIKRALLKGYQRVLYVDADAEIKAIAPSLDGVMQEGSHLGMALGYTRRFNSGVMLVLNAQGMLQGLDDILAGAESPLLPEDDVGWGENGHVIAYAKMYKNVQVLDCKWNNNGDPHLVDYIRHYSAGPLRTQYTVDIFSFIGHGLLHYLCALGKRLCRANNKNLLKNLYDLTFKSAKKYPLYF